MTCSLALDHRVHLPPLCLANKAKTDVAASVGFGVDGCYTEQVSGHVPRAQASGTPQRQGRSRLRSGGDGSGQASACANGAKATLPISGTKNYTDFQPLLQT